MVALVDLDDAVALDWRLVGAKAASLAAARRRGCPVLAGFVVPVALFAPAIEAASALVESEGVHAAQLALSLAPLDPALEEEIRDAAELIGERYVCRSSSAAEGDPRWSGAFTSFVGVSPDELSIAVRGCLASVFRPEVVARLNEGETLASVAPAVLVQQLLEPRCSGTALIEEDGGCRIDVVAGSPAALLSGWAEGQRAVIAADGSLDGPGVQLAGSATIEALGALFHTLGGLPGTAIEWGARERPDAVVLLQVGTAAPRPALRPVRRRARIAIAPDAAAIAERVAPIVAKQMGPLAEALLFPWRLAPGDEAIAATATSAVGTSAALERAQELAGALNAQVLSGRDLAAAELTERIALRCGEEDLRLLAGLRVPQAEAIGELLACCEQVRSELTRSGALPRGASLWALDPEAVRAALTRGTAVVAAAPAPARWQRLFQLALESSGRRLPAEGVAAGIVAGIAHHVSPLESAPTIPPQSVIVLDRALARYAPLLWRAAGLICRSGSESAHLFEVARSRRVPAAIVRSSPGAELLREGALVLVDGDGDEVLVLEEARALEDP